MVISFECVDFGAIWPEIRPIREPSSTCYDSFTARPIIVAIFCNLADTKLQTKLQTQATGNKYLAGCRRRDVN